MTTYWLLGETVEDGSDMFRTGHENTELVAENYDEGIDDDEEVSSRTTVTFHVSHHDNVDEDAKQAFRTS